MSEHQLLETTTQENSGSTAEAIEGAAFLARSEHRVRVLGLLADGPYTREELLTGTDVTRVTLSRTLGDLADRGWLDRHHDDGRYAITDTGAAVYDDFSRLLETITVGQRYPDVIDALPTDWFDFELRCLVDSDIVATDGADPLAGMRVVANAVGRATTVRAIVSSFTTLPMYAHAESLHTGDAPDATVVFDRGATDVSLENPDLVDRWQMIEPRRSDRSTTAPTNSSRVTSISSTTRRSSSLSATGRPAASTSSGVRVPRSSTGRGNWSPRSGRSRSRSSDDSPKPNPLGRTRSSSSDCSRSFGRLVSAPGRRPATSSSRRPRPLRPALRVTRRVTMNARNH